MKRTIRTARAATGHGRHPFRALHPQRRLGLAALLAAIALAVHRRQEVNAKSPAAPHGTLSFALSGRRDQADHIRSSWPQRTERAVDGNLRLDMLFSLTWTNAITLAGLWAADRMADWRWPVARIGDALAWAQWAAALLAVTKDVEKLATLRGRTNGALERLGRWAAITEIVTKTAGIAYAGSAVLAWLIGWQRRQGWGG